MILDSISSQFIAKTRKVVCDAPLLYTQQYVMDQG